MTFIFHSHNQTHLIITTKKKKKKKEKKRKGKLFTINCSQEDCKLKECYELILHI
jgi:hypothetical protein